MLPASGLRSTPGRGPALKPLGPAWSNGSFFAIALNSSLTLSAVFAEVSKNNRLASLAYCSASEVGTARLSGCSATRSALLPARAMIMFSFACRCSSLTHAFALSREDYQQCQPLFSSFWRLSVQLE